MPLSPRAKRALGLIGRANGPRESSPWFFYEKGRYRYPDGREIKGSGVLELIEEGVFKPDDGGLFGDNPQVYRFDPKSSA